MVGSRSALSIGNFFGDISASDQDVCGSCVNEAGVKSLIVDNSLKKNEK